MGFVGEWRPHRPREAFNQNKMKSPGPKYSLPSTIGCIGHDGGKKKAPSFSFGTRHAKFAPPSSPGPSAYVVDPNITRKGGNGTPKYSLHKQFPPIARFSTPGPGHDSPEKAGPTAYRSAPIYSLSSRTANAKQQVTPGPAAYAFTNSDVGVLVNTAPSYSMTARATVGSFHQDLRKTPGPGTYKPVDPSIFKTKGASYSMIGRNMMPTDHTQKPGPGVHFPENVTANKVQNPKFSFGTNHMDYYMANERVPGLRNWNDMQTGRMRKSRVRVYGSI